MAFESPDSILLARGSAVKPTFERMKVPKGSSSKAAHIQLPRVTVRTLCLLHPCHWPNVSQSPRKLVCRYPDRH